MKRYRMAVCRLGLCVLLLGPALPSWSQEEAPAKKGSHVQGTCLFVTDQDVFVPVTSIEWGTPDRWSFTSRYVHMFEKDRDGKTRLHNLTVTLIPGTDGGRLGVGYQAIFIPDPVSRPDWAMFLEARAVLVRTWESPLETEANRTLVGGELRFAPTPFLNVGAGYYWQISPAGEPRDAFWGFHVGVGM